MPLLLCALQYYGSAVVPGTSQLMIVMELMAASAGDVVGAACHLCASAALRARRCGVEVMGSLCGECGGSRCIWGACGVSVPQLSTCSCCCCGWLPRLGARLRATCCCPPAAELQPCCTNPAAFPQTLQVGEDTGGEPLPEPCIAYVLRQVGCAGF